jgi:signal transduction histidine kinase
MTVDGVTTRGVQPAYLGTVGLLSRRPIGTYAAIEHARAVWRGFVQLLAAPDPTPTWRSRAHRWGATALTILGIGLAAVAVVRVGVILSHPHVITVAGPNPRQPSGLLGLSAAVAPLLVAARYPLIAWRAAYLVALLVPLVPGEPRVNILQAVLLVVLFCVAGLRQQRPVLWSMWALMLATTWIWVRPGWERPAIVTICLSAVTLALDAIATSARTRAALDLQVQRTELEVASKAVLEERARIAREMHDVVAHHMSMIAVQAETAPYRLDQLTEPALAELATLSRAARDALVDMRKLLGVLRCNEPAELAPQPQLSDIPELVHATQRAGVPIELTMPASDGEIPDSIGVCAYRIVQEALSNVARHAPGASVVVRVERDDESIRLGVLNGPPTSVVEGSDGNRSGHGLVGMRERVTILGGSLSVGPDEGGGFAVSAFLPLGQWPLTGSP